MQKCLKSSLLRLAQPAHPAYQSKFHQKTLKQLKHFIMRCHQIADLSRKFNFLSKGQAVKKCFSPQNC